MDGRRRTRVPWRSYGQIYRARRGLYRHFTGGNGRDASPTMEVSGARILALMDKLGRENACTRFRDRLRRPGSSLSTARDVAELLCAVVVEEEDEASFLPQRSDTVALGRFPRWAGLKLGLLLGFGRRGAGLRRSR
jgi:hypothetical protein